MTTLRLFSLLSLLLFLSCSKDEFTRPVAVEMLLEMDQMAGELSPADGDLAGITVTGGRFILSEISFNGYRESGEDYFFTRHFPDSLKLTVSRQQSAHLLNFDMPQGVYERIEIRMEVPAGKESAQPEDNINKAKLAGGIEIWGTYQTPQQLELPFLFVYTALDQLKFTAKAASGKQQLVITDKGAYKARLTFDPQLWMNLINARMMQSAKVKLLNGKPTIIISKMQNEHIYSLLVNRIEKSAHLLIE